AGSTRTESVTLAGSGCGPSSADVSSFFASGSVAAASSTAGWTASSTVPVAAGSSSLATGVAGGSSSIATEASLCEEFASLVTGGSSSIAVEGSRDNDSSPALALTCSSSTTAGVSGVSKTNTSFAPSI